MSSGVAYIHEGVSEGDSRIAQSLYESGAIQVLVVSQSMCFSLRVRAYLVVIMDTQTYNGKVHAYEDVPVTHVLHMVGLANRPQHDQVCAIMWYLVMYYLAGRQMRAHVSVVQEGLLQEIPL